jgi:hypothetical protein
MLFLAVSDTAAQKERASDSPGVIAGHMELTGGAESWTAKIWEERVPPSAAIVLRNPKSALTARFFPSAKASGQHPASMALADANRAHGEIAARRAIPFQRSALAEPWPPSLEPIFDSGS